MRPRKAVQRHPGLIASFQRRDGALPFRGLFSYLTTMRLTVAREIYGKWLDEILAPPVIEESNAMMSSRLYFAADAGPALRRRLEADAVFRREFLPGIWPRFRDSMVRLSLNNGRKTDIFFLCGSEPLVWDFFRREDASVLFCNVGMDAVTMLATNGPLHPNPTATFLTRTVENGAFRSEPVELAAKTGAEKAALYLHQWREDISAWWIGNASVSFE